MKIGVASEGKDVSKKKKHCTNYNLYDVENGVIVKEESIVNPGHQPGFLPNFLADKGINVIISGGMGKKAVEIFKERGVEVVTGAEGDSKEMVEKFLKGELVSMGSFCSNHDDPGKCGHN